MFEIGKFKGLFKDKAPKKAEPAPKPQVKAEKKQFSPEEISQLISETRDRRFSDSDENEERFIEITAQHMGWTPEKAEKDMKDALGDNGVSFRQYCAFGFSGLDRRKRNEFYTNKDAAAFWDYHRADDKTLLDLMDRSRLYKRFNTNLSRAWLPTEGLSFDSFKKSFGKQNKVIYKPLYQGDPEEIRLVDLKELGLKKAFEEIMKYPVGVVEECLTQKAEMAALYPGSLNILKLATLKTDKKNLGFETGKVHFLYAALGMGRSGAWTDDLMSGGLIATVGLKGGKVMTDGVCIDGTAFETHPDTGMIIKGFEVPFYKEAKDMVANMAVGRQGYYEWSIAITENGPRFMGVDVFADAYGVQLPYAPQVKGMRKNMDKYFDVSLRPEMPYGTRVTKISSEGIEFYWKKPEHAKGYVVYRSYDPEDGFQEIARIKSRAIGEYIDADYDRDKEKIYYQVRSFIKDAEGEHIYSPVTDSKEAAKKIQLEISHENLYLYSDSSRKLQVYYEWSEPKDVEWSADAPEVASVDGEGVVTAHKTGVSNITCFCHESGTSVTCRVTVNRQAPEPLGEITSRYEYSENEGCYVQSKPGQEGAAVIMMVGDMMCGKTQSDAQWDPEVGWNYNDSYEYVRKVTKDSDLAVGNLETLLAAGWPYMSDEAYIENKNNCNSPSRYLDAVKYGGIDAVVMSNNHNCDGGTRALAETIEQVDRYNFIRTGVYKDASEKRFFITKVNGIKVGFLSYNSPKTGFNFKDADWSKEEKDTMLNIFNEEKIKKDVKDLRDAGAEYVIVYMHWGIKNFKNPTDDQIREATQAANAGVDYIVGSNPHVLQRFDILTTEDGRKVPCAYSIGNFQSIMKQVEGNRDSVLLRVTLKKGANGKVVLADNKYVPFYTYTNIEGCRWAPVPLIMNYDFGIKRVKRKESRDRIFRSMGDKIKSIGN